MRIFDRVCTLADLGVFPIVSTCRSLAVTCVSTLEKGLTSLESVASEAAAFDVALFDASLVEPLLASAQGEPAAALTARFTNAAKKVAIVLMHEEEDVSKRPYMIEAIRTGVVDVVKFPLAKQCMRTLWQHAVRRMMQAQGVAAVKTASTKRTSIDAKASNSSDSSASEERALKRQTPSPTTVLEDDGAVTKGGTSGGSKGAMSGERAGGVTKAGGKKEADAPSEGGAGTKKGAVGTASTAVKQKPQARSTQQWKAAEQRGRRLAIKPHTAVVQAQSSTSGVRGGMQGYWQPVHGQQGAVIGQTQLMNVNGQQVQVWVPMQMQQVQGGVRPGAAAGSNGQQGGQTATAGQQASGGSAAARANGQQGSANANVGAASGDGQQQQPQQSGYMYSPQGAYPMQVMNGYGGQQMQGMVLVQQANGQQMYVQQAYLQQGMVQGGMVMLQGQQGQWVNGHQQGQFYQVSGDQPAQSQSANSDGKMQQQGGMMMQQQMPDQMQPQPMLEQIDQMKGQPLPIGLNLKRTNSLQNIMSGSLSDDIDPNMANAMFGDVEMLEEDALDAILAQAKDGNLLSFDGMDEAMLEAAANSGGSGASEASGVVIA